MVLITTVHVHAGVMCHYRSARSNMHVGCIFMALSAAEASPGSDIRISNAILRCTITHWDTQAPHCLVNLLRHCDASPHAFLFMRRSRSSRKQCSGVLLGLQIVA